MDKRVIAIPATTREELDAPRAEDLQEAAILIVVVMKDGEQKKLLTIALPPQDWASPGYVFEILQRHQVTDLVVQKAADDALALITSFGISVWADTSSETVGAALEAALAGDLEELQAP